MYARITTGQVPAERIGEVAGAIPDDVRQSLAREPGFKGSLTLVDRQSGKVITIGLWESEAAVQASAAGHQARLEAARSTLGANAAAEPIIEVYEVVDEIRPQG
jgi:heme-degrading monooxygenase HmoA